MITYATFIATFPEFNAPATYPQAQVEIWIPIAYAQLNANRFGASLDLAAMLFVAHNIIFSARAARETARNIVAGQATGPKNSASVDKASVGYDTGAVAIEGAGEYNYTSYGQRLYKMMQRFCSGPLYAPGPRRLTNPYFNTGRRW